MKKRLPLYIFLLFLKFAASQTQSLKWVKPFSTQPGKFVSGIDIAVDTSGNVYSIGSYQFATDFDPGLMTYTLPIGANTNGYVSKLDPNGNFLWARALRYLGNDITGSVGVFALGVAVDKVGNVFVCGQFNGPIDFDPGIGSYILNTSNSPASFVLMLDIQGNFLWAKKVGEDILDVVNDIKVDNIGNPHITGLFSQKILVAKLDPLGNITWSVTAGGNTLPASGIAIAVDAIGNVYATGRGGGGCDFDPGPLTFSFAPIGSPLFIAKYNSNGTFIWAGQQSAIGCLNEGRDIEVDKNGNMYILDFMIGGGAPSTAGDMDPGVGTYTIVNSFSLATTSNLRMAVSKLANNGNLLWVASYPNSDIFAIGLELDANANAYVAGDYLGVCDFDPGLAVFNLSPASPGGLAPFMLTLNTFGQFAAVQQDSAYTGNSITVKNDFVYETGVYGITSDFNFEPGSFTISSVGAQDVFVSKKSLCTSSLSAGSSASVICAGQNATLTGAGGQSYFWSMGNNSPVVSVSPSTTTTYTLSGIDTLGCFGSVYFTQNVNICTAVKTFESQDAGNVLFPNPNLGVFSIKADIQSEKAIYELRDTNGILIEQGSKNSENNLYTFRLAEQYPSGIYIFSLIENGRKNFYKLLLR
jgi:hypothetical protein